MLWQLLQVSHVLCSYCSEEDEVEGALAGGIWSTLLVRCPGEAAFDSWTEDTSLVLSHCREGCYKTRKHWQSSQHYVRCRAGVVHYH